MQLNGMNLCDFCFTPVAPGTVCPKCGLTHDTYHLEAGLLPPGTILNGKYIIGRVLGRGGFGATYLAYSGDFDKVVAIKEYLPISIVYRGKGEENVTVVSEENVTIFEKGAKRFFEEAKTISRFNSNKNIVSVYEFFHANDTVYYSMEYLEGTDLKRYIAQRGGKLSEGEAVGIIRAVCNALIVVHSTQTLHRDISPDNIFMCSNGDIKLIDFGAAKQVITDGSRGYSVVLKKGFAPVEQYSTNGKQGVWTDIYALGATFYYMLCGKTPPDAMSIMENGVEFDNSLYISNDVKAVIRKCLSYRIEDRFPSVVELLGGLDKVPATIVTRLDNTPPERKTTPVTPVETVYKKEVVSNDNASSNSTSNKALIGIVAGLACLVIVLLISLGVSFVNKGWNDGPGPDPDPNPDPDPVPVVAVDNNIIDALVVYNSSYTDFGIYMENINTGYTYGYNEDASFLASAMSQVVIMDSLSQTVNNKNINIDSEYVYFEYMPNGKESPLSEYESQTFITLRKCFEDVAIYGDNNKSNHLVDFIGQAYNTPNGFDIINRMLRNNGYSRTSVNRKTFINMDYVDTTVPSNTTTPREIANMYKNLVKNGSLGNEAYMKNIFQSVANDGKPIGLKKYLPDYYNVCNVNALTGQSTNNVAIISDGNTEIVVAILSCTDEDKTNVEDNELRELIVDQMIDYIVSTQFEN